MYTNKDIDYLKYLKSKKVVIFGAGENGKSGFIKMQSEGIEVIVFCDNDGEKQKQEILGVSVISFERLCEINNDDLMIVICSNSEQEIKKQLFLHNICNVISISQIDFGGGENYYNEQYFEYQKYMGEFGGKLSCKFFQPYIRENMTVVEFGSGGGDLLANIKAKGKIGIEINDAARMAAKEIGVKSVKNVSDIPNNYADIIISSHALEHVENPLGTLRELREKLQDEGKVVFVVPNESCDSEYSRSEVNNHLYTWNCLTLGNLFKAAGFFVQHVETMQTRWPKHYFKIEKEISPELFDAICAICGRAYEEKVCVIVAYK